MDAWIQWNRDGFVAGVAGAVTTAFDQRFVRVHAHGAWLVAVAEPLQRPNAHGSTGGEVGRKIFPPFGDCSGMSRGLSLDGGALVRSRICCRQFANCWVQLPVPGGACWDVRLGEEA